MDHKALLRRIIDLSYKHKLAHIGSCITALPIIAEIYAKHPNDVFVLSSGHAGLALYVVLEAVYGHDAEQLYERHGVHPSRCLEDHIVCSSGSLGHALSISCGFALAAPDSTFRVLVSDGECYEGSVWEALRFIDERLDNVHVYVNANGVSAYREVDIDRLHRLLSPFAFTSCFPCICLTEFAPFPFLHGIDAHYHVMTEADYAQALRCLAP